MSHAWRRYRPMLLILLAAQIGVASWYLWNAWNRSGPGFPYDDSWIYAVFARNLAQHGTFGFQPGQWSGGTSSLTWVLPLALCQRLGLSAPLSAVLCGMTAWIVVGFCFFTLLRPHLHQNSATLVWTFLLIVLGPLTYLALSGMETPLFLALSLLAAVAYSRERYKELGLLLALLVLTRIEGLAMVGVAALAVSVRHRRQLLVPLLHSMLPPLIALLCYGLYNISVTGHALPSTMSGRKWLWGFPDQLIVLSPKLLSRYFDVWRIYIEGWLFHAYALPTPLQVIYRLLIWGTLSLGTIMALIRTWIGARDSSLPAYLLLFWWAMAHNLTYLLLAPFASIRHQVPNLVLLVLLLFIAWQAADGWLARRRRWLRAIPAGVALIMAIGLLPSVRDWQRTYADHVEHINRVHVQAGNWIDHHLPLDSRIAAFDIGAVAYFGQREVLDLGGLTNPDFATQVLYPVLTANYVQEREATHLVMPELGGALSGMGQRLGLVNLVEKDLFLEPLASFQIEPRVPPPFDALPSYFYLPAHWQMSIYHIVQGSSQ